MIDLWLLQVVVGIVDPNPQVGGFGIQTLRDNGVEVHVGCFEDECYQINKAFMQRMSKKQ